MITQPSQPKLVQRLVAALSAWSRQARDRRQLESMNEGELRDLGIGRSQIPSLTEAQS